MNKSQTKCTQKSSQPRRPVHTHRRGELSKATTNQRWRYTNELRNWMKWNGGIMGIISKYFVTLSSRVNFLSLSVWAKLTWNFKPCHFGHFDQFPLEISSTQMITRLIYSKVDRKMSENARAHCVTGRAESAEREFWEFWRDFWESMMMKFLESSLGAVQSWLKLNWLLHLTFTFKISSQYDQLIVLVSPNQISLPSNRLFYTFQLSKLLRISTVQ